MKWVCGLVFEVNKHGSMCGQKRLSHFLASLWETEDSREITGGESYQEAKKTDNLPVCWDIQKKKKKTKPEGFKGLKMWAVALGGILTWS